MARSGRGKLGEINATILLLPDMLKRTWFNLFGFIEAKVFGCLSFRVK
jgi:hypothetical protein